MNIALLTQGSLVSKKEATWLTLYGLANEYINKGHKVFICAKKNKNFLNVEQVGQVKVYRIFKGLFSSTRTIRFIEKKESLKFDIIHGFSSSPLAVLNTYFSKNILFNRKIKKIHTIKSLSKSNFFQKFVWLLNLVNFITVSSDRMRNNLISQGCKKNKIQVIKSNIDLEKFKPNDKKELKKIYGYIEKKLIFYYGAMNIRKGVDYLIQALPLVIKKNPNIYCILAMRSVGNETKEKYDQMIIRNNLQNFAKITLKDVPIEEYVSMADLVVLPYSTLAGTEENPSCLLESMASKTLVLTTNLLPLVEHFQDLVLMAEPKNIHGLATKINQALSSNMSLMIEKAYQKSKEFDVKIIANDFLSLYSGV